jgi:hypothetical protein
VTETDFTAGMKNWNRNFDEAPFNENRTIIRLNALLMFVSLKTYFVHILFFCFISFIGIVLITNSVFGFTDIRNLIIALPILLLPSVLFWTSGVMKEPLLLLGVGLCLSVLSQVRWSAGRLLKLLFGIVIILVTKFFVLVCLIPALIAFLLFPKKGNMKFILAKYALVSFLCLLVAFDIKYAAPGIDPAQMLVNKQTNALKEARYFNAGSIMEIPAIENNPWSIMKVGIAGIWNTITRPYVWEAKNIMMLASAIENVFIISWLLMCISFTNWKHLRNLNLFLFLITFSLAYFAIVGMATPVAGNLVRYKAPLLPLFMFAFIIVMNPQAVANSLDFVLRKEAD